MIGSPRPNTLMLPFCADTLGMRSSRCSIVPAFSSTDPATVVVIPPFLSMVLGRDDFTTTSPNILLSATIFIIPAFSPVQSFHAVLYPTDVTFIIPLLQAESMAKCPSSPLTTPLTKAESCLFKSTTLAKAKGSPFSSTIFPFISCAIIGVIAEKHRNVISVLLFIVSIFYFAGGKSKKKSQKSKRLYRIFLEEKGG